MKHQSKRALTNSNTKVQGGIGSGGAAERAGERAAARPGKRLTGVEYSHAFGESVVLLSHRPAFAARRNDSAGCAGATQAGGAVLEVSR